MNNRLLLWPVAVGVILAAACSSSDSSTPTVVPSESPTTVATEVSTASATPEATATVAASVTATPEVTVTATAAPEVTATATPGTATVTSTPIATATAGPPTSTATAAPPTATATAVPPTATATVAPPAAAVTVEIRDFAYSMPALEVEVGTTVTWVNRDPVQHDADSVAGIWNSPLLSDGDSFSQTFNSAGQFQIVCSIHSFMQATVTVR